MNHPCDDSRVLPLPLSVDAIDREWLTAALGVGAPGVRVDNVEVVDINHGTCTKIRLRLEMDEAGQRAGIPETVILKGGFESHSREMFITHEKEVRAYRDLFPSLKLPSPACYFAGLDRENRQGIVIIEDLVARGVAFCHPLKPQTYDEVARRLSVLATFHADSWNSPGLNPGERWEWVEEIVPSFAPYMGQFFRPDIWKGLTTSPRGAAASVRFHEMEWMIDTLERLVGLSRELPHCILHGDTHLGNLYVDPDGTPGFFDPQPHSGPSLVEVAYHVGGALDPADRARWEDDLLRHYLDELKRNGVQPPGFDEAKRCYSAFLALGYCIFLVNATEFQPEAINTAYTARFSTAMLECNTLEILRELAG